MTEPRTSDTHPIRSDNRRVLNAMIAERQLAVSSRWLEWPAEPLPSIESDRARGMLLGCAIGDALGNTSESMNPAERFRWHGEIDGYLPNHHAEGRSVGLPSDDTQLTFLTLEELLAHPSRLDPARLMERFTSARIYGIGRATSSAFGRFNRGASWDRAGSEQAGNGALMRISPLALRPPEQAGSGFWADVAATTVVTHRDPAAVASSLAWVAMLRELLTMGSPPARNWWFDRFVDLAADVEPATRYRSRGGDLHPFQGTFTDWLDGPCRAAATGSNSVIDAGRAWYSGAYLLETVPTVLDILARHAHEPEQAMIRAINDTRDNDTIAAIVGTAVGALWGTTWLDTSPGLEWRTKLLGRVGASDDGRVFELVEQAVTAYATPPTVRN